MGRVAPESKVKIFQEKLPNHSKNVRSNDYGKTTKRASSSYVRKPSQVVLPPIQHTQYRSQQDFMQYDESLAVRRSTIRGIVKPNLIRKDLMKLRDPIVRPRAPKQTVVVTQEVAVRDSIKRQQELLPMIPQPPPRRPNNSKVHASVGSHILILPTIPQNHGMSGIPSLPLQPSKSRSRPASFHRNAISRVTALPFQRRQ